MGPPLLTPKLRKFFELIQHADSDIVDLLGLPTSEKGLSLKNNGYNLKTANEP